LSDSNRTQIAITDETTYGTTPSNPPWKRIRVTGSGLTAGPVTVESKELRSDRMVGDLILVGKDAGGSLPGELSYGSLDDLLPYQFMSAWVRTPVRDNNGTADSEITDVTVTTGVYTILTTGSGNTDFHFGAYAIGQLVRASGFTNSANNVLARVSAATATSVTLGNVSVAEPAPAAAAKLKVVGFRGAAGDITATATGLGSTALNFTTLGLAVGQWIKVGGSVIGEQFGTAVLNTWLRITAIAATALTCDGGVLSTMPAGWTTDTGAAKTITVWIGDYIRNGTTSDSMSVEEQYQDLVVPEYTYYDGVTADELTLGIKAREVVTWGMTLVAQDVVNQTSRIAGSTDIAAPTNDVLNASGNVGTIAEAATSLTGSVAVTSADITWSNSKRRRNGISSYVNQSDASGTARCKVKMSMYYGNNTIRTKILAGTASSFQTRFVDSTAANNQRAIILDLPRIKYNSGNPNVPGIDTDRTIDPEFSALYSSTFLYEWHWQRFDEVYLATT
jgi:hypothetical protein